MPWKSDNIDNIAGTYILARQLFSNLARKMRNNAQQSDNNKR